MKKNTKFMVITAAALALVIGVPQVQAFAVSALSIFRVGDTKTITITLEDIAQMTESAKLYAQEKEGYDLENKEFPHDKEAMKAEFEAAHGEKPGYLTLTNVNEFAGFDVNLPRDLKNETPELYATEVFEKTFEMKEGESVTVAMSPMLVAKYEQVVFMATQGFSDTVSAQVKEEMWEKVLSVPILTENIRAQLAAIDPTTNDIYLPVITGVSREADLGGRTGYLYSASDMKMLMGEEFSSMMPSGMNEELNAELNEELNAELNEELNSELTGNVIIWTKNNVLYVLAGEVSDSELIAMARSVR